MTFMPIAMPRSCGENSEMRMAVAVPKIIALPIPWSERATMSIEPDVAMLHAIVARVKKRAPEIKTFRLPFMSASLPKGRRKTAVERRYEVTVQLNETTFIPNSFPIAGKQRFMALPIKGVRNPQRPNISRSLILFFNGVLRFSCDMIFFLGYLGMWFIHEINFILLKFKTFVMRVPGFLGECLDFGESLL